MGFKARSMLICIIITWPCYALMLYWVLRRDAMQGGVKFLICCFGGLLVAFLVTLVIQTFSKNVKGQNAIETEFEKNGYSDRYIEITQSEIDRLKGKSISRYYIRYVVLLANAYLFRKEPHRALETINLINPENLKNHTKKNAPVDQSQLMQFFAVQMCVSEDLNDLQRAHNVMNDAAPYITQYYGKIISTDILIDEMYVTYYCMCGDFSNAMKYADHTLLRSIKGVEYIGYALKAKVFLSMGNLQEARNNLEISRGYAKKKMEFDYIEQYDEKIRKAEQNFS